MRTRIIAVGLIGLVLVGQSGLTRAQKAPAKKQLEEREYEENKAAGRAQWLEDRITGGFGGNVGEILIHDANTILERDNSAAFKQESMPAWEQVGTSQDFRVSGRATGIGFNPKDPNTIYLCEPQGGLWKTVDHGRTWTSLSQTWTTLAMGAVGVDPNNPQVIYAATGDIEVTLNTFGGVGMYKSIDGGLNWTLVASTSEIGSRSNQVIVDPSNSNVIYHAGNSGITKSMDAGGTWTRVLQGNGIASMALDPTNTQHIVVGLYGSPNSLNLSNDGGATWKTVSGSLGGFGRATVAMSPSNPMIVYASINGGSGSELAASTDGGATWKLRATGPNWLGQQGGYANAATVSPTDPNTVIVGGLDNYRSNNGGQTFSKITDWGESSNNSNFTHADIHVLTYGTDGLYALTDGGIYHSVTDGTTWQADMNKNLATFQFVGIDADPKFTFVVGGAQDNGVSRYQLNQSIGFTQVVGGDGGNTIVADDGQTVYSTYVYADMHKSLDGGKSWLPGGDFGFQNILTNDTLVNSEGTPFYMDYAVCASDPDFVAIAGSSRLWFSNNGGGDFASMSKSGQISGGPSAVHIATADPSVIYAGGKNGGLVYCSFEGGPWKHATKNLGTPVAIETDANDPSHVFVATNGSATHFWTSTDAGVTWTSPSNNFPNVSVLSMTIGPDSTIFVGTTSTVLASHDGGVHWITLRNNLPILEIMSLHVRDNYLLAGTYGRGAFRLDLRGLDYGQVGVSKPAASEIPANSPVLDNIYPNPVTSGSSAEVGFVLPSESVARLSIYDVLGREVRVIENVHLSAGIYHRTLDLSGLSNGHYYYGLTAAGRMVSHSFVITR